MVKEKTEKKVKLDKATKKLIDALTPEVKLVFGIDYNTKFEFGVNDNKLFIQQLNRKED